MENYSLTVSDTEPLMSTQIDGAAAAQGMDGSRGCLLVVEALDGAGIGADHGHLGGVIGGAAMEQSSSKGRAILFVVLHGRILAWRRHGRRPGRRCLALPARCRGGGPNIVDKKADPWFN